MGVNLLISHLPLSHIRSLSAPPPPPLFFSPSQCDFETVYASGLQGKAGMQPEELQEDLEPLFDTILRCVPKPMVNCDAPLQLLVRRGREGEAGRERGRGGKRGRAEMDSRGKEV